MNGRHYPPQNQLLTLLGVVMAALLTVAYLLVFVRGLLPQWQAKSLLEQRLAIVQEKQDGAAADGQSLPNQLAEADGVLAEKAAIFLTERQAATLLDALFQYATAASVELVALEARPTEQKNMSAVYDVRQFSVVVEGELPHLLTFIGLLRETAVSTVTIKNLQLTASTQTLTFELWLYTSPLASGDALLDLPIVEHATLPPPAPAVTTKADELFAALDEPWAREDWATVLSLIEQIVALDPAYPTIQEKQISALINDGYQRLDAGDMVGAKERFETAVALNPQSSEAQAGLTAVEATQNPQTIYIVQAGDTLFSIAQRYGTTVADIRSVNNLPNNNISPQQQLIIPSTHQ